MAATNQGGSHKRPWLAALLAMVYPGLGHLYLREWLRALMWFGLIVSAVMVLLPASAFPETVSLDAYLGAAASIPIEVSLAILGLSVLSVYDAYRLAREENQAMAAAADDGRVQCPHCGKEIDADLDFCHWCTERLESSEV